MLLWKVISLPKVTCMAKLDLLCVIIWKIYGGQKSMTPLV